MTEYTRRNLVTDKAFYQEALLAMSGFNVFKEINSLADWDKEHIFYNAHFLSKTGKTLKLTKFSEDRGIYTCYQLLEERIKAVRNQPVRQQLIKISDQLL